MDDLDRNIARLERDVEQVRARKERNAERLASGRGPARELEALQHEIESLNRRQNELEDAELELMEQREQAQAVLDDVESRLATVREKKAEVEARRNEALARSAPRRRRRTEARKPLVGAAARRPSRPLRPDPRRHRGIGAALLRAGRCGGCRLELAGSERARVKAAPPDEVVRCDECRRIMIRTPESGL